MIDPLSGPVTTPAIVRVPNQQPLITNAPYRIGVVGEAPGVDEVAMGKPFVGHSGRSLESHLEKAGINRHACFVGNCVQERPAGNRIAEFTWGGREFQEGIAQLKEDLATFKPHLLLLLGSTALHVFRHPDVTPRVTRVKGEKVFRFPDAIGEWRGSMWTSHPLSPMPGVKCIATYHPAAALRQIEFSPLIRLDIMRAAREGAFAELRLPHRILDTRGEYMAIVDNLVMLLRERPSISIDIEGGLGTMSCISIATDRAYSILVPFARIDGSSWWETEDHEMHIWELLVYVLGDASIPKILQNSLYDRFVLQYGYGIVVRGVVDDTMLKHWELYCEMEKSLGFQNSIYTDEPYYKSDRLTDSQQEFFRYCCKDSATTFEINEKLEGMLSPVQHEHYRLNMRLLDICMYMQHRGLRYDDKAAKAAVKEVAMAIYEQQVELDEIAGTGLLPATATKAGYEALLRSKMCHKKHPDRVRKAFVQAFDVNMRTLLGEGVLTKAERGRLHMDCDVHCNTKSMKQYGKLLYETLVLPVQRRHQTGKPTLDYEALLTLFLKYDLRAVELGMNINKLRTRMQQLETGVDPDGRIRCQYNVVGTECVAGDTYILTKTGYRTIKEIYKAERLPRIWNGTDYIKATGKVHYMNVAGLEITTELGLSLKGTLNHPVLASHMEKGPYHWTQLSALRVGMFVKLAQTPVNGFGERVFPRVPLPVVNSRANPVRFPFLTSADFAEWIGMWLADGTLCKGSSHSVRLSNRCLQARCRFLELGQKVFGIKGHLGKDTASLSSAPLVRWLISIGLKEHAGTKEIPSWIMRGPPVILRAVLRGLTLDTHIVPGCKMYYGTISPVMRRQIQLLLRLFGIQSYMAKKGVLLLRPALGRFRAVVGFVREVKLQQVVKALNTISESLQEWNPEAVRVKSIKGWRGDVYDLSMTKDAPFYNGNGFMIHNTARWTCYESATGSGTNMTTIPKKNSLRPEGHPLKRGMRHIMVADEGCYLFQMDLGGSDLWTVAANVAACGNDTMLEDMRTGIKPHKVLCLMRTEGTAVVNAMSREQLKEACKSVDDETQLYAMAKKVMHGINYLMGPEKGVSTLFKESQGTVRVTTAEFKGLSDLAMRRYRVDLWHKRTRDYLKSQPYPPRMTSASGQTRIFWGRPGEILAEALANEPQQNTTHATNLAADKLWRDPENRIYAPNETLSKADELENDDNGNCAGHSTGSVLDNRSPFRLEPLHQVHDSLLCQAKIEDTAWCISAFARYFANPMIIAGIEIVIPAEGKYGTDWAMEKGNGLVGTF